MISKLFSFRAKGAASATRVPDGRRIYAIGDIHGRDDLLEGLLEQVRQDDARRGGALGELIFLGDLMDRGPDSAKVVDRLIALRKERPGTRFLLGNHEEVFLAALGGEEKALRGFIRMGGRETILSYGITPEAYSAADYAELTALFQAAVPPGHRSFIESFEDMIVAGDYVFVHAGIRPGVALEDQRTSDLRWIREDFLRAKAPFEKVVVHGHTIERDVAELPHRIGIDTGAYRFGTLTAMGFERSERWLLQEHRACEPIAA
jgi:serine/threonine protein phosphatase 1